MKVTIGKPVPTDGKKNIWDVELKCKSKGAETYHRKGSCLKEYQPMIDYLNIADTIREAMNEGYACDVKEVVRWARMALPSELFDKVRDGDMIKDICTSDDGQFLGIIEGVSVFWYDSYGVKHNCEVSK